MSPGGIAAMICAGAKNVEQVTTKVSEVATDFIDQSGPAVKVASALISAAQAGKGREKKKKKKAE